MLVASASYGQQHPVPTVHQLRWHQQEYYLFIHFGPNTFTDKEWGHGDEPEDIFNPTQLDCRQWTRIAKSAGAKGIIITAKHHDGFCLWPSKFSTHTVRESKWRNGKGDVLKDLSRACKESGLKFGVYISPWDRNHPQYGTPEYNDVFVNMMTEIFTNYGPIWELWWDGANGEGPNGKMQVYDWDRYKSTVKKISPSTVIFSDIGPHVRWVGNERGIAGKTNWNLLDTAGYEPGLKAPHVDTLNSGNMYGEAWIPAECDVSIRPGWFYHKNEDTLVKTPEQLFQLYLKSVGRGSNLLLNVPPDRRGLIHPVDSTSLIQFRRLRTKSFSDTCFYFGKIFNDSHRGGMAISFPDGRLINCLILNENIQLGQNIQKFSIELTDMEGKITTIPGTTIGWKRIITFPGRAWKKIELHILEGKPGTKTSMKDMSGYLIEEHLIERE